jgi:hypothetical protein
VSLDEKIGMFFGGERAFVLKNKAALRKLILHMEWNNHRLALEDMEKYLKEDDFQKAMEFGWFQKTKHPGEFYELTPHGIEMLGNLR